jgi:hypothetical protein
VQLVAADATTGTDLSIIMSFSIHSGLGFDITPLGVSSVGTDVMYDDFNVYNALAGVMFGRSLYLAQVGTPGLGGDSGDTYAVAPPAFVSDGNGGVYLSLVAVYPAAGDTRDSVNAGRGYRIGVATVAAKAGRADLRQIEAAPEHHASQGVVDVEIVVHDVGTNAGHPQGCDVKAQSAVDREGHDDGQIRPRGRVSSHQLHGTGTAKRKKRTTGRGARRSHVVARGHAQCQLHQPGGQAPRVFPGGRQVACGA